MTGRPCEQSRWRRLLAAVFGLIDYLAIPAGTRAQRLGLLHGVGNVGVVVLFALSWLLRSGQLRHVPTTGAFVLALLGALVALDTAWLGGELVDRLGVGVDSDANLDAPASYTTRIRVGRAAATPGRAAARARADGAPGQGRDERPLPDSLTGVSSHF